MSSITDGEAMPLPTDSVDVDSALKVAIKRCEPGLDRKLQELTRQGTATSWRVEGDVTDVTQALARLISAASDDAPEGGEIIVALSPLEPTATVSIFIAGAQQGPSRTLVLGRSSL